MTEKVIDILSEFTELEKNKITEKSNLISDLAFSSLDVINAAVAFEDEFQIEIPDACIKNMLTVGDIVEMLEKLQSVN